MWLGDRVTGRLKDGAGRAAVLVVVAILFWLAGDRLGGLESRTYDLMQRLTAGPAPADVIVISTDASAGEPSAGDLWDFDGLADLVGATGRAKPAVIALASPAPRPVQPQDVERLRSLIELETRAGSQPDDRRIAGLAGQLLDAESRLADAASVAAAMTNAGNVVLGLAPSSRQPAADEPAGPCTRRLASAAATYAGFPQDTSRIRHFAPAAPELCEAAAAIGHLERITGPDGIVRRNARVANGRDGGIPPVSIAATLFAGAMPVERLAPPFFTRYYAGPGGSHGFAVLPAADVLAGNRVGELGGRIVVIGDTSTPGTATPVSGGLGPAIMLATDLANLAAGDQVWRPGWLPAAEILLAVALAIAAAFILYPLAFHQAVVGTLLAAGFLLLGELLLLAILDVWAHLGALALFCLATTAILQVLRFLPRTSGRRPAGSGPGPSASSPRAGEELDLAFSVLRQQPTSEPTKQKLYDLAMEHGRRRDYARAERVFRHLSVRDPHYRDVAAKLEKLSGARVAAQGRTIARPAASKEPVANNGMNRALGRYELERVIGRGAMATVYLGRDPTINRRVAIKTVPLAEEFADNDLANARSNFIREAQSSGRLNHPNIIAIHDAGEDNNVAYLAMEYFEGHALNYYAQVDRLLPPRKVCDLMARAAETLHYAHTQNVVHRDVKPANLLYDEATDTLKLTDFGIARLTDTSRTRTGIILGTPSYMSPEQLRASKVTGQSDLYSLGVTMYHLLTGAPPFQADSIARLMDKIANQPHKPVRDVRDDVPSCVDAILDRALAKNPDDRFPDGQAMALALRDCCSRFPSDLL